jgi:hypothetical protein
VITSLIEINSDKNNQIKNFFPKYFQYIYWFLSGFYSIEKPEERFVLFIQNEEKISDLELPGFELLFVHLLHLVFNEKILLRELIHLLNNNKLLRSKCESSVEIKSIFHKNISIFYDNEKNNELLIEVFNYHFTEFIFNSSKNTSQFIEKVLPYYIEKLLNTKNIKLAREICKSLTLLSKNQIGLFLSLENIVEPITERLTRKNIEINKYITTVLINIGKEMGNNGLNFFLPKMLNIITNIMKKKYSDNLAYDLPLKNFYRITECLLIEIEASNLSELLIKYKMLIEDMFHYSMVLKEDLFKLFSRLISQFLYVIDLDSRINVIRSMLPSLKIIFNSEVKIPSIKTQSSNNNYWSGLISSIFGANKNNEEKTEIIVNEEKEVEEKFEPKTIDELFSDENTPIEVKNNFKKVSILYKMLCCALGNTTMRSAIVESKRYEQYLQSIQDETDIFQNDFNSENYYVNIVDEKIKGKKYSPWFINENSTSYTKPGIIIIQ